MRMKLSWSSTKWLDRSCIYTRMVSITHTHTHTHTHKTHFSHQKSSQSSTQAWISCLFQIYKTDKRESYSLKGELIHQMMSVSDVKTNFDVHTTTIWFLLLNKRVVSFSTSGRLFTFVFIICKCPQRMGNVP